MGTQDSRSTRVISLDQFRGYTVLGMLLVNYLGRFDVPAVLKHHNSYCSYADTIMPQFFFAVGFAYRLTFLRRLQKDGWFAGTRHVLQRNLGLILLGIVVYHLDGQMQSWAELQTLGLRGFLRTAFQREAFQTLVHIGVTALWVLPVIAAGPVVRILFAAGSGLIFLYLSHSFYYDWVMQRPGIDGGPLGFLTWTIPMLVGSLAYDIAAATEPRFAARRALAWGAVVMVLGYGLSCLNRVTPPNTPSWSTVLVEPPFVSPTASVNVWTMSQRAGSLSYLTFAAGFSLAVYALFIVLCDVGRFRSGVLETFGKNALAAYIIHEMVLRAFRPYTPPDSPGWFVGLSLAGFYLVCYAFLRHLEKHNLYLRL
jgi:predicted acyltransferase